MKAFRSLLAAILIAATAAAATPAPVGAADPPPPPARFAGRVLVNGGYPPPGQVVKAYVGTTLCGTAETFGVLMLPKGSWLPILVTRYVIDVAADSPSAPGCGYPGAQVRFSVGAHPAVGTYSWYNYDLHLEDLYVAVRVQ